MKKFLVLILFAVCNNSFAESVTLDSIDYVYELESTDLFDFAGGAVHQCGSNLYRVHSSVQESVKRKFSMLLMAFASGKRVVVNAGACSGSRRLVGWVQVHK